jgi:hypothetical protein
VIHEEPKVGDPETVALDAHVQLLRDYRECQTMIEFWTGQLDKTKAKLAEVLGDATQGTIGGESVFFYEPQNRFRSGDFKKKYPDTAKYFTREFTVQKLDTDWLQQARPELWEEFQTRAMRNTWVPPGDNA